MAKKLLVITAGTVAAGVGQEIIRQMKARPNSDLQVMVRYIDTAFLPNRYGTLRAGQWFQMSIGQRFIEAVHKNLKNFPRMETMLFPGLLPGTDVAGGGSIRYNGAGAVEIQRDNLRKWLSNSMADLASSGNGETNISIALIVSSVGATGSGSLEHLIEVIVDAAYHANIKSTTQSTIRCDAYILQPGIREVTDLGLANTLALYAELAASQLTMGKTATRYYQGRKIMVGWGSNFALSSIEQLKEAAATLVRLSTDPTSSFSAEFQEREVDNHVLRELDPISDLPMHLSTATVVTISLGNLVEQVIQHDVAELINNLVFSTSDNTPGKVLLAKISDALSGDSGPARFDKLLDYLSSASGIESLGGNMDSVIEERGVSIRDKGARLDNLYEDAKTEIKQSAQRIGDAGRQYIDEKFQAFEQAKAELILKGYSLSEIREEFRAVESLLYSTIEEAVKDTKTTNFDDDVVKRQIEGLSGSWISNRFGGKERLEALVTSMKNNLDGLLHDTARNTAFKVLEDLENYCVEVGRNLDVVVNKLRKQRDNQEGWALAYREASTSSGHPLHMMALTPEQIKEYKSKVSIFTARTRSRISHLTGKQGTEQLIDFRQWLEKKDAFEALFEGNIEQISSIGTAYVKEKVLDEVNKRKVIDILLEAGDGVLQERLAEAAAKAVTLVSYDKEFAPDRREAWHVSVDVYRKDSDIPDEAKREKIQNAIDEVFSAGKCTLLPSKDPSEIAVYYYVDGLPISAIDDLKGRCLNAFLNRRQQWRRQQDALNGNTPIASIGSYNQRVGVPVYSGRDAEARVIETCVIKRLYEVKGSEVGDFSSEDIPELGECKPLQHAGHHEASPGMNGHAAQPVGAGPTIAPETLVPNEDNQPGQ